MEPLAIVGMACRFPGGADSPAALWELLVGGVDAIGDVPADRWGIEQFYDANPDAAAKTSVRQGGFIHQPLDAFDAQFFGISPREAAFIDPQQRLLLETAWEAFEDAGIGPERLSGSRTGTFIGVMALDWLAMQMVPENRELYGPHSATGSSSTLLSNRISYVFNLLGPSISIDTACSSSLVAVHYACRSIWNGECAQALAGGVNLMFGPNYPILMSKGRFLSPDARCKAFDERANGYVRGEGAGVVFLQPLSTALQEGRTIHALILGTAVNQDGHTPGITVPSQQAQESLLREACGQAGAAPRDLHYVEAHGTGTAIGDVIEANALGNVLGDGRRDDAPCLIGSVKTNIGHLEAAAGVAGLIKTVLCLKHRQVPGNLHFNTPNPKIPFEELHLRVPTNLTPWPESQGPARAGVNSFGFGGTNAHVILEETPASPEAFLSREPQREPYLLPLSARSAGALEALADAFLDQLDQKPALADLCYSASVYRGHHDHRLAIVGGTHEEMRQQIEAFRAGNAAAGIHGVARPGRDKRLVFVYTGMGPQWWGMGRELLHEEPVFRAALERVDALFQRHADWSLLAELTAEESRSRITQALFAQTSNFAIQVALTELWRSWGIEPDAVVGHSVGEVAASWAAGVFDLESAVRVSYHRASLQARLAGLGKMLAVGLSRDEVLPLLKGLEGQVDLAAVNSPSSVTLTGEADALESVAEALAARGAFQRSLQVEVAYHSHQMEQIRDPLLEALDGLSPARARVPLYSTVTGGRVEGSEFTAAYWWRNVREPVRLQSAIEALSADGYDLFLEIGPHPVLGTSIQDCLRHQGRSGTVLPSLRRKHPERPGLFETLGRLYVAGHPLNWETLWPHGGRRLSLPSYPWQRESYWAESTESREDRLGSDRHPLLARAVSGPVPTWESELNAQAFPYLADHRVEGKPVFPGSAYVEAGLAIAHQIRGEAIDLEEIEILKPLVVEDAPPVLRLSFTPATGQFTVHSRSGAGEAPSWMLHASGQVLESKDRPVPAALDFDELRGRLEEVSVAEAYRWFAEHGLPYGPMFRATQRLWRGKGEALAELFLAPELVGGLARTWCHPTLLDAGIQALLQALVGPETAGETVYLPVRFERVRYYARHAEKAWGYVRVTHRATNSFEGDVVLLNEHGTVLVEARGVRLQAVPRAARAVDRWTDWLYETHWEKLPPIEDAASPSRTHWLIVGGGAHGRRLALALEERGQIALTAASLDRRDLQIGNAEASGWQLVYLGGFDVEVPRQDSALSSGASGLDACAGLLAALEAFRRAEQSPRQLVVVTFGAREVDLEGPVVPGQAALVGLTRVIGNERPDLPCRCLDLGVGAELESALCAELLAENREPEVALLGAGRYAPRLRQITPTQLSVPKKQTTETPALSLSGGRGSLDALTFHTSRRRSPGPGEVELRVRTVGLNFKDVLKAMGMLSSRITEGTASGELLGLECSATVERVGEGVSDLRPGDAVLSFASGCFATYLTVKREDLFPAWPGATPEELATVLVTFATAYYSLHEIARLEKGESVLIHAASGGVGLAALQIARWKGAMVFATAGSPEKRDYLRSLDVEHVMGWRSLAFADEIHAKTNGRGVDVVLNSLSGKALLKSVEVLAPYGRFIEIGKRDIDENNPLPLRSFNRNLLFAAVDIDRLRIERPERMQRMTEELLTLFRDGTFRPLPHVTFPAAKAADAFRHLAQAKQIGKVVVSLRDEDLPVVPRAWEARLDATYLVTGGLGGVGLKAARWLVASGARYLVLIGRQAPSPEARATLSELEAMGARVQVASLDVSDSHSVDNLFAKLRENTAPVRGVLHLAASLDDAPYHLLTRERLANSLAPKAVGAWNLHRATRDLELDFFVLFSSISVVVGNPGQGNYVAANAFLDALAELRRREGLPALSVHWGALAGAGMLARNPEVARTLEVQGLRPAPIRESLEALSVLLTGSPANVTVADVDWGKWAVAHPRAAHDPRFADLVAQVAPMVKVQGPVLDGLSEEERREMLTAQLRKLLARVIRQSPEQVPLDRGLDQLGVDSLLAVELQTLVHTELGVSLATVDLMRGPTLTQLAATVLRQTAPQGISPPLNGTPRPAEVPAQSQPVAILPKPAPSAPATKNGTHPRSERPAPATNGHHRNGKKRAVGPSQSRFETFPEYLSLRERIEAYEATGARVPFFRVQERTDGPLTVVDGRELVSYSGYNYLGLSGHPRVTRAAQEAVARFGTSVSASRMVSGERPLHGQLETGLASWLGTEDAVVFVSGYLTNVTVIGHLLGPADVVFHDALVHNSALTGIKLSGGASAAVLAHNDWQALGRLLHDQRSQFRRALIVLEGVYSMDGDFPDLPRFVELKKEHDTLLMVDEAHSLGVLGRTGRGIGELFGTRREDVDLWMGTLSKTLASCGGYIAGSQALVSYLRNTVPGLVYSVGLSPADTAAALAALELVREEPERVSALQERAAQFLRLARARGLNTGTSGGTAVIPVIVGNSQKALELSEALFERGINAAPIFFPAVEDSEARLRFFITCRHTEDQVSETVDAVAQEWARLRPALVDVAP